MSGESDEFFDVATRAGSAFEELRRELKDAATGRGVPPRGTLIGDRYRVESELGEGGFGTVFAVHHEMLGHKFALKLLNPRVAEDPDWVSRFREEARATSLIGHEAIVYVTDFGEDPEWGAYFVMEYLQGRPLDRIIDAEAPLDAGRVLGLVRAAAGAFGAVHDLGIVHCDLKPSNVFAVRRGRREIWKFLDFGTSTIVMSAVETEALYGTPLYMAPEQSIGREVDGRADQFSLGCVVYEMLTGEPPWEVRTWLAATPEQRRLRLPIPPDEINPAVPSAWSDAILQALALDPDERFARIEDFAQALDEGMRIESEPMSDPLDQRPDTESSSRSASAAFRRTMTAPHVSIGTPAEPPSVVIDVETGEEQPGPTEVRVSFRTRERFIREVRRNLSVGGLFVPSDELLELRSRVVLEVVFEPTGASRRLGATVVGQETRGAGRGFGLHVDDTDRALLDDLIDQVRGPMVGPNDRLERASEPADPEPLSPGQGFVLSRIDGGLTVARLRSMCAGLPFDVDDVVRELVASGWVVVTTEGEDRPVASKPRPDDGVDAFAVRLGAEEIGEVLDLVDVHRGRGNYLGATQVLRRAIDASPEVAEFHYRLALLRMEFDGDYLAARAAARRAARLEPENSIYVSLLESLQNVD